MVQRKNRGGDTPAPRGLIDPMRTDVSARALVEALRQLTCECIGQRLEQMFDSADDLLFEMAGRAENNNAQRVIFDAMRVFRLERQSIAKIFREELAAGFSAPSGQRAQPPLKNFTIDDLALRESRAVEEMIAVSNMETKAENLYLQVLWEIDRRLEWLVESRAAPLSREALSPASICRAFQKGAESLEVELDIQLVIYKLFDRRVISDLAGFYNDALSLLIEHGVQPATIPALRRRQGSGSGGPGASSRRATQSGWSHAAAGTSGKFDGPSSMSAADPHTIALLQQIAGQIERQMGGQFAASSFPSSASVPYGDADLANDLATAMQGRPIIGWADQQVHAYAQRTGLVGQMFNDLLENIELPESARHHFDLLRFSAIKSALKDSSFFTDARHPVRGLIAEMTTMAATARVSGSDSIARLEQLITAIRSQFEENAANLRAPQDSVEAVDDAIIERFIGEQEQRSRSQRKALVTRVREIVVAEFKLRTAGYQLPHSLRPLLFSGWSVIMAYYLTHHGAGSEAWDRGVKLLERIVHAVEPRDRQGLSSREIAVLSDDLRDSLLQVGITEKRVETMLAGFDEALSNGERSHLSLVVSRSEAGPAADTAKPIATAAEPNESLILDLLLVPGRWFQVHDAARDERRWLKFTRFSETVPIVVVFMEFNGKNPLELAREQLMEDLIAHRSEPIDAPPACRQALETLIARRARNA